ncbi:MAG: globin [Gammaproteobacteria bacterium]|nr:MAG: globin [Gammaproteobacteria bacterium]
MAEDDPVLESFELAAESGEDITTEAYERFYARCPPAREVMSHVDPHMQGRMLEEVLELLMTPTEAVQPGQIAFEVGNHRAYGTLPEHYRPLLEAVRDTVRAELGRRFDDRIEQAWDARITTLLEAIEAHV